MVVEQASPAADRRTLLRRLSLDLTGLPPTPAEVAAFAADPKDKDPTKSAWTAVARVLLNLDEFITRE